MERVNYSQLVQEVLTAHSSYHSDDNTTETQLILDTERHHYQIVDVGWEENGLRRVYACTIHIDIKQDKIWIQRDLTEIGIANELVAAGVPKNNIILAYKAPYKRKFTGFAVE